MYKSMNWSCFILCTFVTVEFNILVCDSTNMRTWVNDTFTGGISSNVLYLDQSIQCYVLIYLYVCHPEVSNNTQHCLAQYISCILILYILCTIFYTILLCTNYWVWLSQHTWCIRDVATQKYCCDHTKLGIFFFFFLIDATPRCQL